MTNKVQSMLTFTLAVVVLSLLVDRGIQPAHAQECATRYDVVTSAENVIQRVLYCMDGSSVDGTLSTYCNS